MKSNPLKQKQKTYPSKAPALRDKIITFFFIVQSTLLLIIGYCTPVYAAGYAENFAKFFFEQAFWIVLVVAVIIVIKCAVARNFIQAGITIVIGAVLAIFVKTPDTFVDIGEKIVTLIKSGS